jgi:hypothetical protein
MYRAVVYKLRAAGVLDALQSLHYRGKYRASKTPTPSEHGKVEEKGECRRKLMENLPELLSLEESSLSLSV